MHQQLEKGVRKLYITMQDTSDVIFVGMLHKRSPRKHQCQLNWHGSVKAMEPDMFVEMVKDTAKKGVPVVKVAGDDDHISINRYVKVEI